MQIKFNPALIRTQNSKFTKNVAEY